MSLIVFLFAVSLLHSLEAQGSMTDDSVFVKRGENVLLSVKDPITLDTDIFFWKLNQSNNIARYIYKTDPTLFEGYKERVVFFVQNQSLLLKNLQQNDTGIYTAVVSRGKDQIVATHGVIVQEPVSAVILTVTRSSSGCNLTVTCTVVDSHIKKHFRCDNQTCSPEPGEGPQVSGSSASINVYVQEGFIICNHSNHVSWEQDRKKDVCEPQPVPSAAIIIGSITGIFVLAIGIVIIFFRSNRCKCPTSKKEEIENTVYAVPQETNPGQTILEGASAQSPTSTYALVGFHTGPGKSTNTINTSSCPETIYAQVDRGAKTNQSGPPSA